MLPSVIFLIKEYLGCLRIVGCIWRFSNFGLVGLSWIFWSLGKFFVFPEFISSEINWLLVSCRASMGERLQLEEDFVKEKLAPSAGAREMTFSLKPVVTVYSFCCESILFCWMISYFKPVSCLKAIFWCWIFSQLISQTNLRNVQLLCNYLIETGYR